MPAPAQDAALTRDGAAASALDTRVDLALHGVQVDAPVARSKGAGPSDDGHVVIDGQNAPLPRNPASPYAVRDGRVFRGGRCAVPAATSS